MRLRSKLLLPLVAALSIILALEWWLWMPRQLEISRQSFVVSHRMVLNALTPELMRLLQLGDLATIHATLDQELTLHAGAWKQLELFAPDHKRLFPLMIPQTPTDLSGTEMIQVAFVADGHESYHLQLWVNWRGEQQPILERLTEQIQVQLLVFVVLLIAAMVLQHYLVRRPLLKLHQAAVGLAHGEGTQPLPVASDDEIGQLIRAFGNMRVSLLETQEQLRQNEDRLLDAQRIARLGHWEIDLLRNRARWGEQTYRILGIDPALPPGSPTLSYTVHPDDWPRVEAMMERVMSGQGVYDFEYRVIHPDGQIRHVHSRARIERDVNDRPVHLWGIVQDITARVASERQLRESENRYRSLMQGIHVAILIYDDEAHLLDANLMARELLSLGPQDFATPVASAPSWWFVEEQAGILTTERWLNLHWLSQGVPLRNRLLGVQRSDAQEIIWVLANVEPVMADSRLQQIWVSLVDVSDKKRVEDELACYRTQLEVLVAERTAQLESANQQLLETQYAMDHAGIGIQWIDTQTGQILYTNGYAATLLGYQPEEMIRLRVTDFEHELHLDAFQQRIGALRRSGSDRFEAQYRRSDGQLLSVEITSYFKGSNQGGHAKLIHFVSDISERKRAERDLLNAKEIAETANRSKSIFLANMSHELRTPLNAILGFAQLMRHDASLSPEQQDNLSIINRSGEHLLTLINDVLEISRIEAGRTDLNPHRFDLGDLVDVIVEMMSLKARSKNLLFRVLRDPQLPHGVYGDEAKLRQVLINLLANAIKFTDHGEVRLELSGQVQASDEVQLKIQVVDTGIGIPVAEQQRIFEPFRQAVAGEQRGEGTGLGLAISREYVHLLGGELKLHSTPEVGSVFSFSIPLKKLNESIERRAAPRRVISLLNDRIAPRVLVVEDQDDSRQLLRRVLEQVGFHIDEARDGQEAIDRFQIKQPHFIWMDMRMPVLDGFVATQRIRALPRGDQVKIVALTASAFKEDRHAILAAGCDDVLSKPLNESEIFSTMGRLLQIEFRYAEETPAPKKSGTLTLAALPAEQLAALQRAAELLDVDAVESVIQALAPHDPGIAEDLMVLVRDFRFDTLLELCQQDKAG